MNMCGINAHLHALAQFILKHALSIYKHRSRHKIRECLQNTMLICMFSTFRNCVNTYGSVKPHVSSVLGKETTSSRCIHPLLSFQHGLCQRVSRCFLLLLRFRAASRSEPGRGVGSMKTTMASNLIAMASTLVQAMALNASQLTNNLSNKSNSNLHCEWTWCMGR